MESTLTGLLAAFLLPPLNGLALAVAGAVLQMSGRRRKLGTALLWVGLLSTAVLGSKVAGNFLIGTLEAGQAPLAPDTVKSLKADALVVLGGGSIEGALEYGGETTNDASARRVRYGALVARASGLPVLVSGGAVRGGRPEARLMADSMEHDHGVRPRWVEDRSPTTRENARLTRALLPPAAHRIVLVTDAWHMPRARAAFEARGFEVVPAPCGFESGDTPLPYEMLPSAKGMTKSWIASREWLGTLYYRLRD